MAMTDVTGIEGNWLTRTFDRLLDAMVDPGGGAKMETDDARARRDFLLEKMDACPEAFASERDICQMMHLFPGRF